ncbi:DedA family protein [Paenibacillus sp. DMB20]|uniref:DedA family protein n=1 Tax=Paenibacillus sp. DMB20 TaxID=1642570 RepID=UPI00069AF623|nr:DedA family protein [Paenibacillus sp. DMB20]
MGYETLIQYIGQIGHIALFMALCLGIVGLPLPNEVVAVTGGALSASSLLDPLPAFAMVFLGLCSGATTGYLVSRYGAGPLLNRAAGGRLGEFMGKYEHLNRQYGNYAISLSVFLPVFRTFTPYVIGMRGMSYRRFAVYSYSASLIWSAIYFHIGMFVFG